MKSSTLATNPVVQSYTHDTKGGAMRRFALAALAAAAVSLAFSGIASAKATFGQCGPAVHSGSGLVNAWGAMGVLNTPAAAKIAKSAGWKPMDGGMVSFLVQRGREFPLAQPANIEDYGCRYGNMYSVGKRHYGAGEKVIAIVPNMYNPNQISAKPRKGYHRVKIWAHTVGRANCSNGFAGYVLVIAYVPNKQHTPAKPKPIVKPKPKPQPSCGAGKVRDAAGNCVVQTNQAEQNCKAQGGNYNQNNGLCTILQVNGNCSNIVVVNGNGNTVSTTQQGNCNTSNTPPPTASPTYACTGLGLSLSDKTATATIGVSTTGGAAFKDATVNWGDSKSTSGGLNQTHTYSSAGNYGVSAVVNFSLPNGSVASANCSGSITIATTPPPQQVAPSCNNVTNIQNGPGGIYADGETYPGEVTIIAKAGSGLVVSFSSSFGSFTNAPIPMTSTGVDIKSWVYRSPNDSAVYGKSDQITVTVTDTATGLSGTCHSDPFVLNKPPTNP